MTVQPDHFAQVIRFEASADVIHADGTINDEKPEDKDVD